MYAAWEAGDLRAGGELFDTEVVSVWPEGYPAAGTYHGPDGHRRAMREWLNAWTEFEMKAEGFHCVGDRVVVPFRVRAQGRESGIEVERRWAHIWTLREGRIVRFEVSLDPDGAIAGGRPAGPADS
ncbi:MAG TPA: nuclear transport factor 2 family protein [Thermoleophilaceae bacterium]|nr:nuclear transport factor 2 family protein [Thermoleophilaceae bacterium]